MDYEAFTQSLMTDLRANGRPTSGPMAGRPLMILTTTGAKSGRARQAVITYTRDGERYVVAATASGSPTHPDWYHNLKANPEVIIEADGEKFRARAVEAVGSERDRLYTQHASERPEFRDYPGMVTRTIPVFTLERID